MKLDFLERRDVTVSLLMALETRMSRFVLEVVVYLIRDIDLLDCSKASTAP